MTRTIPLTILGGSDLAPGKLPEGAHQHSLAAYKGAALRVGGRPLIALVIERFRACAAFAPIRVAGPRRVYGELGLDVDVIDTDGDVATNLAAAIDGTPPGTDGFLAITTCDLVPEPSELAALMRSFEESQPCDFWLPLVRLRDPREIGVFAWKPEYGIVPQEGSPPVQVLPGHLGVFDPRALRLDLIYRLVGIAYRTRNRPVEARRGAMVRELLARLLYQDLRHLLQLRRPTLTWTALRTGASVVREVRARRILRADLERHVGRVIVSGRHRRRHPERGVRLPIVDALSIAMDIDTEEEAAAVGARIVAGEEPLQSDAAV